MISCSISHLFTGAGYDCRTNASHPRTDSSKRTKISPLANSRAVCAVTWTSSSLATCSASSGCARPAKSIRFLRLSVQSWLNVLPSPFGIEMDYSSYVAKGTDFLPGCRNTNPWCLVGFGFFFGLSCCPLGGPVSCLGGRCSRSLALHPVFDVALRAGRHRQRPRRNVLAHHRAGAGVRAVADRHRGHEHRVRPGSHV